MTSVIIVLILIVTLFAIAFFTKRRYGILALGLVTGAMLSTLWVGDLTPIIAQAGFVLVRPPLESVVASALTLLPAILLLLSGPKYHKTFQRLLGGLLFALLATVLLLEPIGAALVIEGTGKVVYDFLSTHRIVMITLCLAFAIADIVFAKIPKVPSKH